MRFQVPRLLVFCLIISIALPGSARSRHRDRLLDRIRGEMEFMASDAMQGRGSGTHDELVTAVYLASELRTMGVAPMGDQGGYVQNVSGEFNFYRQGKKQWNTRNVIGVIPGRDAKLKDQVVLLTAHMDHIGVGKPVKGDEIYNGADDDASGCIAVLQLAHTLARGKPPRHTVIFAFFGSEETGGQGDEYFLEHPPVPLTKIVANLEFEMIGRADPAVKPDQLWLTGYDRSSLGPELARHGAKLVADPHPEQQFFQRSDNFALARKGIVAQTVSSFGLHQDYHQPSDDVAHVDFAHMEEAIQSMMKPVKWLANSKFKPEWVQGKKP
ncbi:MAG TPA: M20/M25/M40 family metallo-hydrolase [Candidatus Angelobacter sp.]|nr:M20/M25/M40 family metallo-hydrolase [Candidatus Angelobacter sp.]HKT52236.1 M20/M25/M40 family metallo-hydrolase [Candidatus Angelobacter sp.]